MARTTPLLLALLVAMAVGSEASRAGEGGKSKTLLERWMHGQTHAEAEPISDIWPEEMEMDMEGFEEDEYIFEEDEVDGRELAVRPRPETTIRVTACTTLVIATFPATCKNYSSPAPCSFTYRQQGVRRLYDCQAIRKIAATSYLDTPPSTLQVRNLQMSPANVRGQYMGQPKRSVNFLACCLCADNVAEQPIGSLSYSFDTPLNASDAQRQVSMRVSAANPACGTVTFKASFRTAPRRRTLVGVNIERAVLSVSPRAWTLFSPDITWAVQYDESRCSICALAALPAEGEQGDIQRGHECVCHHTCEEDACAVKRLPASDYS